MYNQLGAEKKKPILKYHAKGPFLLFNAHLDRRIYLTKTYNKFQCRIFNRSNFLIRLKIVSAKYVDYFLYYNLFDETSMDDVDVFGFFFIRFELSSIEYYMSLSTLTQHEYKTYIT